MYAICTRVPVIRTGAEQGSDELRKTASRTFGAHERTIPKFENVVMDTTVECNYYYYLKLIVGMNR